MSDSTPTLAEFLPRYKADDNEWWRLGSGHHQNLFDEAVEKLAELRAAVKEWTCRKCRWVYPGPPQEGLACVICPRCGGDTMPTNTAERRDANDRAEAAERKLAELREAAEKVVSEAPKVLPAHSPSCQDFNATDPVTCCKSPAAWAAIEALRVALEGEAG